MRLSFALAVSLSAFFIGASLVNATEWKTLESIDAKTIRLDFDDMVSVDYGKPGNGMKDQTVVTAPIDLDRADKLDTYTIVGATALKVGRKTLPHDFVRYAGYKAKNALDHSIYLTLSEPLKPGGQITVSVPADFVSSGAAKMTLSFDPAKSHSDAVHANQFGYLPDSVKFAQVSYWLGSLGGCTFTEGTPFHVLDDATRTSVFDGTIKLRIPATVEECGCGEGNYAHADQFELDFSALKTPGKFVISVDGVGCSFPFRIADDVFVKPFITSIRGMYHQRCGIELKEPYTKWVHPACHTGPILETDHRYMDKPFSEGAKPPNFKLTGEVRTNCWGGWHDAADWDREANHGEIPARLLIAYQLTPGHYADNQLNIPESGDGLPDIVNEAMWGIDYGKRMQHPNGGGSVGVFMSGDPKEGEVAWTDTNTMYFYADEPVASYKYAANCAHLVPILRQFKRDKQAQEYLDSGKRAYDWAGSNLRDGDEVKVRDVRFHAAAALFLATGDTAYQDQFLKDTVTKTGWENIDAWPKLDQTFGDWTLALASDDTPGLNLDFVKKVRQAVIRYADMHVFASGKRGNRQGFNFYLPLNWGRGSQADELSLMVAHKLTGDQKYYDVIIADDNVTLGSNPMNMTWMTRMGDNSPQQVMQINYWWHPMGINPGIATPGPFAYNKWAGKQVWEIGNPWQYLYPTAAQWPPLELWFNDRLCPPTNEGVVEGESKTAVSMGYLCPTITK